MTLVMPQGKKFGPSKSHLAISVLIVKEMA
jgi:hypothetical protein